MAKRTLPAEPGDPRPSAKLFAFLDANIVLEGRPLEELPWQEVDPEGPILALVTAQAIQEIDSKKRDGRLGPIARAFNRKVSGLAMGGDPLCIRHRLPRVELAFAKPGRIPWDDYDEFDPDDGDARIVAEALHARDIEPSQKVLVSHDIKPISYATGRNLRAVHVSDAWLRPPEPSPNDKAMQRLKQRVSELESAEPVFEIEIDYAADEPVELVRVEALSAEQSAELHKRILAEAPRQARSSFSTSLDYDHGFEDRFRKYATTRLPYFVSHFATKVEQHFNQRPVRILVRNVGALRADKLVVEITTSEGWLHDRFVMMSPSGPLPPRPQAIYERVGHLPTLSDLMTRAGRHDVEFAQGPDRSRRVVIHCEDFRHGREWSFDGFICLNARRPDPFEITVTVTASNMHGMPSASRKIDKAITDKAAAELVDLSARRYTAPYYLQAVVDDALKTNSYSRIDLRGADEVGDADYDD